MHENKLRTKTVGIGFHSILTVFVMSYTSSCHILQSILCHNRGLRLTSTNQCNDWYIHNPHICKVVHFQSDANKNWTEFNLVWLVVAFWNSYTVFFIHRKKKSMHARAVTRRKKNKSGDIKRHVKQLELTFLSLCSVGENPNYSILTIDSLLKWKNERWFIQINCSFVGVFVCKHALALGRFNSFFANFGGHFGKKLLWDLRTVKNFDPPWTHE